MRCRYKTFFCCLMSWNNSILKHRKMLRCTKKRQKNDTITLLSITILKLVIRFYCTIASCNYFLEKFMSCCTSSYIITEVATYGAIKIQYRDVGEKFKVNNYFLKPYVRKIFDQQVSTTPFTQKKIYLICRVGDIKFRTILLPFFISILK